MVYKNMQIEILTPIEAKITGSLDDIESVKKQLSYTKTSVSFLIRKHLDNKWWKQSNPVTWQEHLQNLKKDLNQCLLWTKNGESFIRPGSIPYIKGSFNVVDSKGSYPILKPLNWKKEPRFTPYDYQKQSVEELIKVKHGNISLPTGAGKSYILLLLAKEMGLDCVVVTPSKSIFNELLEEFQERLGKELVGGYGDGKKDTAKKITITISKSLTMLKPESKEYEFFNKKQLMLIDESHSFASEQLDLVCHGVLSDIPYRFFVSATQTRNDGTEKLLQSIIGPNVFDMSIQTAIQKQYLCPLQFRVIKTSSKDPRSYRKDPMKEKRTHFLYNDNIADIIAKLCNASWNVKQESTLILVEELQQISMLVKRLKVPFGYVHAGSAKEAKEFGLEKVDSKEEVFKFNNGDTKVLIGTRAIATGTNIYPTHNVVNWVGGSSEIVTKQGTIGRSTRKLENSIFKDKHKPKHFSLIFDFDVENNGLLQKQLNSRIGWYEETGESVIYVG